MFRTKKAHLGIQILDIFSKMLFPKYLPRIHKNISRKKNFTQYKSVHKRVGQNKTDILRTFLKEKSLLGLMYGLPVVGACKFRQIICVWHPLKR